MNDLSHIYSQLKRQIIEHEFEAGQKLNQRVLAELFGTSSTPVIKALHRLSSEGLVDTIPNRGFVVHSTNVKELADLYELREALEVTAVADLGDLDEEQRNSLADELQNIIDSVSVEEETEYRKMDITFHNFIISSCNNEMLKSINESHQILNRTYLPGLLREPNITAKEHERIVAALRKGDQEELKQAMREHISVTKISISKLIKRLHWIGLNPREIMVTDLNSKAFSSTQSIS